ncbi:MAG: lysoplasmalogenase [Maritimibacter sp.]
MAPVVLTWAGLMASLIYLPLAEGGQSWARSIFKTLPLMFFGFAALEAGVPHVYLIAGLFLSAFGDFALSRNGRAAFLYGLSTFALAHLVYVLHFMQASGKPLWEAFVVNPAMAIFLFVFGILAEIWLVPHTKELRWPVRIYMVAITAMGLAALTLPMGLTFVGVAFFIASDTLLALQLFRLDMDDPLSGRLGWAVWISYIAGQSLILTSASPLP